MVQYNYIIDLVSELLYKHDCVIIPNFGGFVARNYGSSFSKGNNLLYPQTKYILFNKNLMHNDGLLVSALMEKSHVSYTEAEKLIADCKDYIQSLLSAKKRFELSNIGLLYIDAENTLRFEAKADVNFLLDSFGFEPVLATELILEPETSIVTKQFEDRKAIVETPVKQKRSYVKIAALAVGLPLTLTLLLLAAGSKPMKPILESSLNPFYSPEKTYTPLNFDRKVVLFNKTKQPSLLADANGFASFTLTANGPILVAANDTIARVDKTMVTKPVYHVTSSGKFDGKFQVVVGCFGVEENAEKLIRELMTKKIKAGISGTNAKGLHVVSCGGFNSKEEASSLLANIKTNYPNAWVMAK
jgi:hypothetical protein